MGVYIIGFALSIFMLYYAESKRFRGTDSKISVALALLIPCLIAGLRDYSIGTDVRVYVENLFMTAERSDSLIEYLQSSFWYQGWKITAVADVEIGFTMLVYLINKVFGSLPVLLFVIQALTVIPIYKGLRAMSGTQPVWLGMAVYYLMFFNQTLNVMRQWIAMAFLFYAFQYLAIRNHRKYFLIIVWAILFHVSAAFGLLIFLAYQLVAKENTSNKRIKMLFLIMVGVLALCSLDVFVNLLNVLGLRYGNYINGTITLMPNQFLYRLPILLLLMLRWKHMKKNNQYTGFYLVMIAYDILASQLTGIFAQSGRISMYFSEYFMLAYPAICSASNSKHKQKGMQMIVICYLCVYWWYIYVYRASGETVPYISIFD